jgi:amidophosphoribosyltransferase
MRDDKFREECGLVGVWDNKEASNIAYLCLYSQQHRGQEGAGVVACDGEATPTFRLHRGLGLVSEVFDQFDFSKLPGNRALGHVRYTTAGSNILANVQPFFAEIATGPISLAHNGNLINADSLREELISQGAIFGTTSDTEVFLHLIARAVRTQRLTEAVISSLEKVKGAYSLLFMTGDRLIAVRDPNGFRPLVMGTLGGGIVFASETCAFDLVGAEYVRDVEPGEVVEVFGTGDLKIQSYFPFGYVKETPCVFEYVYFARPDSNVFGRNVYEVRKRLGAELALESPVEADLVIPVPDSGVPAALGYSQASRIPFELGLIRNHYVGRTFIEPKQSIRDFGVKVKLNANPELLKDKRIIVIDDSIVRGTTSKKIVDMLRSAGAQEVHLRVSAPPTISPCYYGIDTPTKRELIASNHSTAEIAQKIGVDTLAYLSLEGLYRAVRGEKGRFCDACFSGNYPVGTPGDNCRRQRSLF